MLKVVHGSSNDLLTIHSPVLGRLEIASVDVIDFVEPIAGFPDCARYALMPYELAGRDDLSMSWLQAVEAPFHTFLVTDPWSVTPGYQPEIADREVAELQAEEFAEITLLGILTVVRRSHELTINLQAPVLINTAHGCGKQVLILNSESYDTRVRVCDLP